MQVLKNELINIIDDQGDDIVLRDIKKYYYVTQSNELINMKHDLTLDEYRIIRCVISLIQPNDEEFKSVAIKVKNLADMIGIENKNYYKQVQDAVESIHRKVAVFKDPKNKYYKHYSWVDSATYIKGSGIIIIKLADDMKEHLIGLTENYTSYKLQYTLPLKSEYSIRLYEILYSLFKKKIYEKEISIKELRFLLNIENKLEKISHFKKRVLDKAQEELEKYTNIKFEYRNGKIISRKVHSIIFKIMPNKANEEVKRAFQSSKSLQGVMNLLQKNNIKEKTIIDILSKKYDEQYLHENIVYALEKIEQAKNNGRTIENPEGYIISAINKDYAGYKEKQKKIQSELEKKEKIKRILSAKGIGNEEEKQPVQTNLFSEEDMLNEERTNILSTTVLDVWFKAYNLGNSIEGEDEEEKENKILDLKKKLIKEAIEQIETKFINSGLGPLKLEHFLFDGLFHDDSERELWMEIAAKEIKIIE